MTTSTESNTQTQGRLHPATTLGHVHYTVAHLERQVKFYQEILGFKLHWQEGDSAGLGAGKDDLLRLTQLAGARRVRRTTGLYHTAFLVPSQRELAHLLKSIAVTQTPIQGMTDHGTHYAIYLPDAEGNGIELAWDFPQEKWPKSVEEMTSRNRGLAPETVWQSLDDAPWEGLAPETKVGHVHLHVAHLAPTRHFYRDVLGFDISMELPGAQAEFYSAGGYHHHVGTNLWQGEGAPPPPADATGLLHFTVILPDETELQHVLARVEADGISMEKTDDGVLLHDPAMNGVLLRV